VVPSDRAGQVLGDRSPDAEYGSAEASTVDLDLRDVSQLKLAAITRHVTQTGSAGPFHDWGTEARDAWLATEHYRLAASALPVAVGAAEATLFDGLG
jgi:LmbE family N-acetylglucosaminyl deacetylase